MNNIITSTARTAQTIAAEIRVIDEQVRESALRGIIEIGRRLCEAKELVDHGEWCNYLQEELGYKQSAANNYMKIYREYEANGLMAKSQTFGNLSPSQALALIAVPADEREQFVQESDAENMSARELKRAIEQREEERRLREEAEARARKLEETNRALSDNVNRSMAAESNLKKKNQTLRQKVEAAEATVRDLRENPFITDETKESIVADFKKQADADIERLTQERDAARSEAENAAKAREAAEAAARATAEKLSAASKGEKMADPDVTAFNLLASQIQNNLNSLNGYRKKVGASNPEMGEKMRLFMIKLLEEQRKKVS